jgi:uncharacterized Fe-S cluster-containing radical SAM superfamily protein
MTDRRIELRTVKGGGVKRMLEITTAIGCPNMCKFCPQDAFLKSYHGERRLSYGDFERVIKKLPKDVLVRFSGFTEPFMNADTVKMIKLAAEGGFRVDLFTTLVGLEESQISELASLDLDGVVLHLPDNEENTNIIKAGGKNYDKILALFLQKVSVTEFMTMNKNMFANNGRAGLVTEIKRKKGPFRCFDNKLKYPQFVMLPNCDVVLCCMDFGLKHNLGNLLTNTFDEIEQGKKYKDIKAEQNKFSVHHTICGECSLAEPIVKNKIRSGVMKVLNIGFKVHGQNLKEDERMDSQSRS